MSDPPSPKSAFPPHLRANTDPWSDHPIDAELSIRPRWFNFDQETPPSARKTSEPLPDRTPRPLPKTDTTQQIAENLQSSIQLLSYLAPGLDTESTGCGVQVPITSLSALLSSMQSLGSLISHTRRLCNFDMDTLVQRVGDMLSGEAAQKGVDIVIQHDLSLGVGYGDAEGVILLFAHIVRQYLSAAQPGDVVKLGMGTEARQDALECSFNVTLKHDTQVDPRTPTCQALMSLYNATFVDNTFTLTLPLGVVPTPPAGEAPRLPARVAPTLDELEKFPKTLRGRTATVHANPDSAVARYCNKMLSTWGINISDEAPRYILIDDNVATLQAHLASIPQSRPPPPNRTFSSPIIHTTTEPYIIYFTSIASFARVQELASSNPSVVIVPKPVGPRRLLTALYTAASPLDTLSPLASSPDIPELDTSMSRLHIPNTELVTTPASEYFSSSSGPLIMQTPDGRPYGMYFEPLAPTARKPSLTPRLPSDSSRRRTIGRRTPSGPTPEPDKPSSNESTPGRRRTLPTPTIETTAPPGRERAATTSRVRKSPVATKKPLQPKDAIVPPIKVLIVEDNPINQNILSMFLRKKQIKHEVAKTGLEAVEKWRTGGFHLILMDIQLPVMDGIEATKEIRKLEKTNNIGIFPTTPTGDLSRTADTTPSTPFSSSVIIVALTASSLQSDRVGALAAGCNDFLTKPVSLKWLDRKIVEWGCMQALIDFDGWRRSKGDQRGFTAEAQRAAKTLASRLRIERKKPVPPPEDPELSSISEDVEMPVVKVAS